MIPAALTPEVYSAFNRNEYHRQRRLQIFMGSSERPVCEADYLTAICEPIF
jgi:hypothetical protein